ncbi:hypothetical protein HDV00_004293 [Rhizophlyctis rosea]|nr:hypothetical protein HDV00_004293 [Rhizophlyctis rosea]
MEIARLTAENNHLHADIIKLADERDARERRAAQSARRLESQVADLRFMASQYAHRVEVEHKRVEESRQKAEDALAKLQLFNAPPAGKSKIRRPSQKTSSKADGATVQLDKLYQKLQKIDIETGLEPLSQPPVHFAPPDPVIADLVKLAEGKASETEKLNQDLTAKNIDLENQLAKRDQEIERLGAQLEVARSQQFASGLTSGLGSHGYNATRATGGQKNGNEGIAANAHVPQSHELLAAKARVEQLELQMEFLQEHIEGLEKEASLFEDEKKNICSASKDGTAKMSADLAREKERCAGLLKNLQHLEKMVDEMKGTISKRSNASRPASPQKVESEEMKGSKADIKCNCANDARAANERAEKAQAELDGMRKQLQTIQQEKKAAEQKARAVSDELAKVQKTAVAQRFGDGNDHNAIETVEKLRSENTNLILQLKEAQSRSWVLQNDMKDLQQKLQQLQLSQNDIEDLQLRNKTLQRELDVQRSEVKRLVRMLDATEFEKEGVSSREQRLYAEMDGVSRERDELLVALRKFEHQLSDVQRQAEIISEERDSIEGLYKQVTDELNRLRHEQSMLRQRERSPSPTRPPARPKSKSPDLEARRIRQLQDSESMLKARISELESEIDKLQRDLKVMNARQRENGLTVTEMLRKMENECDSAKSALKMKEKEVMDLEKKYLSLEGQCARLQADLSDKAAAIDQQKRRNTQIDAERQRELFTVRDLRAALADVESRLERLQAECGRLGEENEDRDRVISEQRRMLAELDRGRDRERMEMDKKCERIVHLEETANQLQHAAVQKDHDLLTLREQVDILTHQLEEEDRELAGLKRQHENAVAEKQKWEEEARRLEAASKDTISDLEAVTRESGRLNAELSQLATERDGLKAEFHDCQLRVQYLEDLNRSKDRDHNHLLSQYRRLAGEHEKLELTLRTFSQESNVMKVEGAVRDKRVAQLEQTVDQLEAELENAREQGSNMEREIQKLRHTIETYERRAAGLEADKARLVRELESARDACLSIERSRDELQRRCNGLLVEYEQLQAMVQKLDAEREGLDAAVGAERLKRERLEHLIAVERTRKIQTERGVLDIQQAKGNLEAQLRTLNEQQAITIQSLTEELKAAKEEARALRMRVESLELKCRDTQSALIRAEQKCKELQRNVVELNDQVENKGKILDDVLRNEKQETTQSSIWNTELEGKVLAELANTKRQLRKYEAKLEQRKAHITKSSHRSRSRSHSPSSRTRRPHRSKIEIKESDSEIASSSMGGEEASVDESSREMGERVRSVGKTRRVPGATRSRLSQRNRLDESDDPSHAPSAVDSAAGSEAEGGKSVSGVKEKSGGADMMKENKELLEAILEVRDGVGGSGGHP